MKMIRQVPPSDNGATVFKKMILLERRSREIQKNIFGK
jgi:hypothetical protein